MRETGTKIMITKRDLKRRVVLVRGIEFNEQMAGARDACRKITPDAIVIKEESFEKYNEFRKKFNRKPLTLDDVELVDLTIKEEDIDANKI